MKTTKQYIQPSTEVFCLGANEKLMQDFPLAGSPTHVTP